MSEIFPTWLDREEEVPCVICKSKIRVKRLLMHHVKCQKNYPHVIVEKCHYNAFHVVPKGKLDEHLSHCPDKAANDARMQPELLRTRFHSHRSFSPETGESWDSELNAPDFLPAILKKPVEGPASAPASKCRRLDVVAAADDDQHQDEAGMQFDDATTADTESSAMEVGGDQDNNSPLKSQAQLNYDDISPKWDAASKADDSSSSKTVTPSQTNVPANREKAASRSASQPRYVIPARRRASLGNPANGGEYSPSHSPCDCPTVSYASAKYSDPPKKGMCVKCNTPTQTDATQYDPIEEMSKMVSRIQLQNRWTEPHELERSPAQATDPQLTSNKSPFEADTQLPSRRRSLQRDLQRTSRSPFEADSQDTSKRSLQTDPQVPAKRRSLQIDSHVTSKPTPVQSYPLIKSKRSHLEAAMQTPSSRGSSQPVGRVSNWGRGCNRLSKQSEAAVGKVINQRTVNDEDLKVVEDQSSAKQSIQSKLSLDKEKSKQPESISDEDKPVAKYLSTPCRKHINRGKVSSWGRGLSKSIFSPCAPSIGSGHGRGSVPSSDEAEPSVGLTLQQKHDQSKEFATRDSDQSTLFHEKEDLRQVLNRKGLDQKRTSRRQSIENRYGMHNNITPNNRRSISRRSLSPSYNTPKSAVKRSAGGADCDLDTEAPRNKRAAWRPVGGVDEEMSAAAEAQHRAVVAAAAAVIAKQATASLPIVFGGRTARKDSGTELSPCMETGSLHDECRGAQADDKTSSDSGAGDTPPPRRGQVTPDSECKPSASAGEVSTPSYYRPLPRPTPANPATESQAFVNVTPSPQYKPSLSDYRPPTPPTASKPRRSRKSIPRKLSIKDHSPGFATTSTGLDTTDSSSRAQHEGMEVEAGACESVGAVSKKTLAGAAIKDSPFRQEFGQLQEWLAQEYPRFSEELKDKDDMKEKLISLLDKVQQCIRTL